jgi:xylan 1,4-beta-xylosidase
MIDIPSGPGGEKDPVDAAEMAPLAAALVKIVNVDNRFGIKYWEIPNEREHILSAAAMAAMLSGASKAMKQIDPTILVGGPATEGVNTPYISDVLYRSLADIDFVTVHTYGGDGKQSSAASYESASKAVGDVRQLRERLTAIGKGRYLPIFLDEFNIGWDPNPAIYNNVGAVYFSIIQGGIVDAGGDVSAVWDFAPPHDMSIVQRDGRLTESANLFSLMNQFFYGEEVSASSPDPTVVRIYAVKSKTTQSMVLSNLGASPTDVTIEAQGRNKHRVDVYQISSSGYSVKKAERWSDVHTSTLPERSVTVIISR